MDNKLKLFFSIFTLVFLAELGDKTQIASFSMAAKSGSVLSVVIGACLALTFASLLAVLFGHLVTKFLPKKVLKIVSSLFFLGTGIFIIITTLIDKI